MLDYTSEVWLYCVELKDKMHYSFEHDTIAECKKWIDDKIKMLLDMWKESNINNITGVGIKYSKGGYTRQVLNTNGCEYNILGGLDK